MQIRFDQLPEQISKRYLRPDRITKVEHFTPVFEQAYYRIHFDNNTYRDWIFGDGHWRMCSLQRPLDSKE